MTDIYVQLEDTITDPDPAAPWDYNTLTDAIATGVVVADLKDSAGALTGYTLTISSAYLSNANSAAYADNANTFPLEVLRNHWRTTNGGVGTHVISGVPEGYTFSVFIAGNGDSLTRSTDFTVNGVTATYVMGTRAAVTEPVQIDGTVGVDGLITISSTLAATGGQYYGYNNGFKVVITAGGATDSITPPASITDGDTVTVANTGFASGAPNAGTIGGQTAIVVGTSVTLPDSDLVADGTVVSPIGSQTISLTNGTETAASTTTVALKAGYVETTIVTPDTVTQDAMYDLLQTVGKTVITGDRFRFDGADGSTMTDAGIYDWYTTPKLFTYIDGSNQAWQYRLVNGIVESVIRKLTSVKLTANKLTSVKLEATKL